MPERLAVLKRHPERSSWIARVADNPAAEFLGETPSEALGRLLRRNGWKMSDVVLDVDYDRTNLSASHAEVIITLRRSGLETVCPDCCGLGQCVGLNNVERCRACGGRCVVSV
jgi:hypothetical protein